MIEQKAHPNTRAVIEAWKRLNAGENLLGEGPMAQDYPGVVGRLFILQRNSGADYSFRLAGSSLEYLFGRELAEQNFLSLWRDSDRCLINAAIDATHQANGPCLINGCGATLDGRAVNIEIALAPLNDGALGNPRSLGIYQTLSDESALNGRPIWRQWVTKILPPQPETPLAKIRLVSSNEDV